MRLPVPVGLGTVMKPEEWWCGLRLVVEDPVEFLYGTGMTGIVAVTTTTGASLLAPPLAGAAVVAGASTALFPPMLVA